ncbi:MAG: sigma-70 family RNA polymerase sigma factor [Selenomonadaceae bacterium]|nr:sigma-70 family RNA polymerase sigma factor [Selenomonadaceae bacterium]
MRLDEYVAELQKVTILSPMQENELWRQFKIYQSTIARQKLIESYQPLVFKVAMPYRDMQNIMDIIQEGTVGLIEAVESFDHSRGVAFSLYAVHRIRGRMIDFLRNEGKSDLPCIDTEVNDVIDYDSTVVEQVEIHEMIDRLRQAMQRLPSNERAVLESIYLESEEAKTVAENLKLSVSHIYRLQKQGIKRIRGMLSRFMKKF